MFGLFKKKSKVKDSEVSTDPIVMQVKLKTEEAAKEAKENADKLNKVFEENGITLAIIIAAAGEGKHGY